MKFKIEPDSSGYFLYFKTDDGWELITFTFTFIGAKFKAWRYSRRYKKHFIKSEEFEL